MITKFQNSIMFAIIHKINLVVYEICTIFLRWKLLNAILNSTNIASALRSPKTLFLIALPLTSTFHQQWIILLITKQGKKMVVYRVFEEHTENVTVICILV